MNAFTISSELDSGPAGLRALVGLRFIGNHFERKFLECQ